MGFLRRGPAPPADAPGRAAVRPRSLYEDRELTFWDRLRGRARREHAAELELGDDGSPVIVTGGGQLLGWRAKDGSIVPAPKLPRNPTEWPESMWDEVEAVPSARGWRLRYTDPPPQPRRHGPWGGPQ